MNGSRTMAPWNVPSKRHQEWKIQNQWQKGQMSQDGAPGDKKSDGNFQLPNVNYCKMAYFICDVCFLESGGQNQTVKVFIGIEYECPRGHRFLAASSEKPMRNSTASSSSVRDAAGKIVNCSMPLYMQCPCRYIKWECFKDIIGNNYYYWK